MTLPTGIASSSSYSELLAMAWAEGRVYSNNSNFRILKSYEEVVRSIVEIIRKAREEIYLASRYYEPIVGSKLVQKFAEGVSLNILDGNPSGTTFIDRVREAARVPTKDREILTKLLESPKARIRNARIDYSFIVVDRLHSEFEIIDTQNPNSFSGAVQTDEQEIADRLIRVFKETA